MLVLCQSCLFCWAASVLYSEHVIASPQFARFKHQTHHYQQSCLFNSPPCANLADWVRDGRERSLNGPSRGRASSAGAYYQVIISTAQSFGTLLGESLEQAGNRPICPHQAQFALRCSLQRRTQRHGDNRSLQSKDKMRPLEANNSLCFISIWTCLWKWRPPDLRSDCRSRSLLCIAQLLAGVAARDRPGAAALQTTSDAQCASGCCLG